MHHSPVIAAEPANDIAKLVALLRPYVGRKLVDPLNDEGLPIVSIYVPGSRFYNADIRGCDEFGVSRYFMGRCEFYHWAEIETVEIGETRYEVNSLAAARAARDRIKASAA